MPRIRKTKLTSVIRLHNYRERPETDPLRKALDREVSDLRPRKLALYREYADGCSGEREWIEQRLAEGALR